MLNPSQIEIRQTGIGASEIPAVLGISPFQSPLDVWLKKPTKQRPATEMADVTPAAAEVGSFLEPAILGLYKHRTGIEARRVGRTFRHREYPFILSSPDAMAEDRVIEIKCVGGLIREWRDGVPEYVVAQVQQQMAVHAKEKCDVVMLHATDLTVYPVEFDPELWGVIVEAGTEFWQKYVQTDTPPPLAPRENYYQWVSKRFPGCDGSILEASPEQDVILTAALKEWYEWQNAVAAATSRLEAAKAALCELIGEHAGITGSAGSATWRPQKGQITYKGLAEHLAGGPIPEALLERYRGKTFKRFSAQYKDAIDLKEVI